MLDARVLGKPQEFDGTESAWMNYKFVFESYVGAIDPVMQSELAAAAAAPGPIPLACMTPDVVAHSKSLFNVFVLTWKKSALSFLRMVEKRMATSAGEP